jgi:hypothetical protein
VASSSQVLREYLVSLGFKVNNDAQRVFDSTLSKTNLNVMALGKTVLGVATATQAMVYLFSKSMERMYYSSRLAGSTVSNMQALDFAARSVGVGGDQMRGALEGMARAMRLNPGLRGLVESFGVAVVGRDKADVAIDFLAVLKKMPHELAAQYAGLFGIDSDTLFLLTEGLEKFREAAALRKQMAADAGVDADAAARASVEYQNMINRLSERIGLLKDSLAIELMPGAQKIVDYLDREITRLTSWISTGEYKSDYATVKKNFWGWEEGKGPIAALKNWLGFGSGGARSASGQVTSTYGGAPALGSASALPIGLRQNNPGNLRSWGNAPVANGFAQFGTSAEGLSAMAGNLLAYGKRGLNTVEKIISTWAPKSENNTASYISSVTKRLGVNAGDVLDLKNPDVLAALMGAITQHENGRNPFSVNELRDAANSRLGSVQIQQKTDIHVHGSGSDAMARAVAREQGGVNADLASVVRNQVGALK